ncbi:MAG: hypothetical protein JNK43_00120 [Ignavibacteria bacterium]|nr:hypothetical protein [Ignavibacteria bacterium]
MNNSNFEVKIKQLKELAKELERKTIEFITASAELEYRYKNSGSFTQAGRHTDDLQKLEDRLSKILKNSI